MFFVDNNHSQVKRTQSFMFEKKYCSSGPKNTNVALSGIETAILMFLHKFKYSVSTENNNIIWFKQQY